MQAFILAMVMHPDVQDKAQKELDTVIGHKRLPTFEDRPSLPYINAIVKELVRWHVVAPTGVPHATVRDDEYNGHLIPGNTMIICNAWLVSPSATCVTRLPPGPGRLGRCPGTPICSLTQSALCLSDF